MSSALTFENANPPQDLDGNQHKTYFDCPMCECVGQHDHKALDCFGTVRICKNTLSSNIVEEYDIFRHIMTLIFPGSSWIILDPPAEIHEILCFARSRHIHHPPKLITGRLRRAEDQGLVLGLVAVQGRAKPQGAIQSWLLHQVSFEDVKKYEQSVAVITRRRMARERRRACYSVVGSIKDIVG